MFYFSGIFKMYLQKTNIFSTYLFYSSSIFRMYLQKTNTFSVYLEYFKNVFAKNIHFRHHTFALYHFFSFANITTRGNVPYFTNHEQVYFHGSCIDRFETMCRKEQDRALSSRTQLTRGQQKHLPARAFSLSCGFFT